ncbi:MAG: 16S rRNA (cytidine(1402)-2'-O)-methyltransferase [Candidatus Puniceispirillales bacterium]
MNNDAKLKTKPNGVLIIVGTPIGNSMDLSARGIEAFVNADLVLSEDTRVTKKLSKIRNFKIKKLVSFNDYNESKKLSSVIKNIKDGNNVVLSSDAGMPLISDPGYKLVNECLKNDILIDVVPGPSSIITAIVTSGLATNNFYFAGFPIKKKQARINSLSKLVEINTTIIWFESPRRILSFLNELIIVFGNRQAVVARELTKFYQEILRDDLVSLISQLEKKTRLKGEYVILIEGNKDLNINKIDNNILNKINILLKTESVRSVVNILIKETDLPKKLIYNEVLKVRG